MARARRIRRTAACLALGATGGCYQYVPVPLATVAPTDEVRVHVTDAAAARLAGDLHTYTTQLDGRLDRTRPDSLSLAVAVGHGARPTTAPADGVRQTLLLAPADVVDVSRRELSRSRTTLTVVATAAAIGLVVSVLQLGDRATGTGNTGSNPTPLLLPHATLGIGARLRLP